MSFQASIPSAASPARIQFHIEIVHHIGLLVKETEVTDRARRDINLSYIFCIQILVTVFESGIPE